MNSDDTPDALSDDEKARLTLEEVARHTRLNAIDEQFRARARLQEVAHYEVGSWLLEIYGKVGRLKHFWDTEDDATSERLKELTNALLTDMVTDRARLADHTWALLLNARRLADAP